MNASNAIEARLRHPRHDIDEDERAREGFGTLARGNQSGDAADGGAYKHGTGRCLAGDADDIAGKGVYRVVTVVRPAAFAVAAQIEREHIVAAARERLGAAPPGESGLAAPGQ